MNGIELETIDKFLSDIQRLQQGYMLLEQVYLEHCPYGEEPISNGLRYKINTFFGFDDSE
jgi:hypothetical protein